MEIASRSCNSHLRTGHSFDKDFTPSAISTNICTSTHPKEAVLSCPGPYIIQHNFLHRGCIYGNIPMHAPGEDLEPEYARTLHQQIFHPLTTRCGKRFYRRLHRGAACEDYMGTTNAKEKEDFRYCGFRHWNTVSLLSATTFIRGQEAVADTS